MPVIPDIVVSMVVAKPAHNSQQSYNFCRQKIFKIFLIGGGNAKL